jgi:Cdc6-like AAA superfamily ATPase
VDIRKDINRWLSPSNVADDLQKHLSSYMKDSCRWLIADPAFKNTLTNTDHSVLRIVARPGAGKSTSAAFLIQHLIKAVPDAVLYFFCKTSDAEKRTTLHILRSLLFQCLQHDSSLYSVVLQWYYKSGRSIADSQTDVTAMFSACLQATTLPSIFIVIDALDECLDTSDLLLSLSSMAATSFKTLKLILLSRDDPQLSDSIASRLETIHLTADKCQASIDVYVKERLAEIRSFGVHRQSKEVAESISKAVGGLWLSARLLLDELHHAPSLGEAQRQISGLPHGLRSLYSSILLTKEKTFSEVQLKMAQELYLWIDETEYMPTSLRWDVDNDIPEDETICAILNVATSSKQLFNPPKIVRQLASPLLEVRTTNPTLAFDQHGIPYDCNIFAIDFFHQTVKQYLNWTVDADPRDLPLSLRPRRLAPLYRGVTASLYLSQSHDFQENLQQLRERPRSGIFANYLEMVYGLWGALKLPHLRRDLDAEENIRAGSLCDQLTCFLTTDKCLGWIEAAIIINYAGRWSQLINNVEKVLDNASDSLNSTPAFHRFHCARQALMADFAYVLASTWPEDDLGPQTAARIDNMPHGFYQRPLARKIMGLARKYRWLLMPAQARSSNCFLSGSRV